MDGKLKRDMKCFARYRGNVKTQNGKNEVTNRYENQEIDIK